LRLRHGSPRDLLIGVTMIRADGQLAKAGGKVVKNVAGYDLGKLLSGSYGTLGVIVEAAFRLHPLPAARAFVTATIPDGARAHEAVQAVLHSAVVPSAIELDADSIADSITLVVLLEGVAEGIAARAEQVVGLLGAHAVSATPPPWWTRYPDGQTLIELTAPPVFLADLCRLTTRSAGVWLRGSAGSGHWQLGVSGERAATEVATLVETLRAELAPHGGAVVVRAAPDEVRRQLDLWGPVPALELMRRVKDQFDPEHRLSPGSFVGGI
jgi:glycolate oxidase FAD binding subunit